MHSVTRYAFELDGSAQKLPKFPAARNKFDPAASMDL